MEEADSPRKASLYVGDLHPFVTEKELEETFGAVGQLVSVHLCRDKISRKSLCYGFVNFLFPSDASTALNRLNYTELRGRPMRIMWYERDSVSRKMGIGNLFVKNLDPSITSARLQDIFSKYGTIVSCKVAEENGKSKGYGFVQFDSEDAAMEALNAVHGTMENGKNLSVSKFVRRGERNNAEPVFTNLYVKNLDEDITDDLLKNKFSAFGNVCSAVIMKDEKGKSKGFGFVNFELHEEARKAMEALNGELLGSKNLFVARALKKKERAETLRQTYGENSTISDKKFSRSSNLYVKNLDATVDDRKLREIFCAHGRVKSAKVIRHIDGTSKGFGFVLYLNPDDANKALQALNGTCVQGHTLYVAMARPKEQQTQAGQPLRTSNWDVPTDCRFQNSSSSIPAPKLSPCHPAFYQNFVRPFSSFYPFGGAMNFPGMFSPYPIQFSTSRLCKDDKDLGPRKYQIPRKRLDYKIIDGAAEEYWKAYGLMMPAETNKNWPGFMHPPQLFARSYPELHEKGPGFIPHPLVQSF